MPDENKDITEQPAPRDEISSTGEQDITRGYTEGLLPIEDDVLDARGGGDIVLWEEVRRDDQVKSCLEQRRRAVVSRSWIVEPGGDSPIDREAADFIREQLTAIGWDRVTERMLWGVFYGYAVAEIVYKPGERAIEWEAIKVRNRRRFGYDAQGRLRYLKTNNPDPGEIVGAPYFWDIMSGGDHDDAFYGLGLAHWLYWPVYMKRNGIRNWNVFLDRFASPAVRGTYPPGTPDHQVTALLSAAKALRSESAAVYPANTELSLLEAGRSGSADYMPASKYHDAAIAKVILGQTMTTDDGSSRSQAEVHMDVRQDLVRADADLVCESFNRGPIRWLVDINFPGAMPPTVSRVIDEEEDLDLTSQVDERLARIGFRRTIESVHEVYGTGYVETSPVAEPEPEEGEGNAAEFASGELRDAADDITDELEVFASQALDAFVDQVRDRVEQIEADGGDLLALRDELDRMAEGTLDHSTLGAVMARAMALADLWGRSDVLDAADL